MLETSTGLVAETANIPFYLLSHGGNAGGGGMIHTQVPPGSVGNVSRGFKEYTTSTNTDPNISLARYNIGLVGLQNPDVITRDLLTITEVGNVGIGVVSPSSRLDVNGEIQARNGYSNRLYF